MRSYLRKVRSLYEFVAANFNHDKKKETKATEKRKALASNSKSRIKKAQMTKIKQKKRSR